VDEESIFAAALGKASPAKRRAFLAEACAGDAELRAGVEALLLAHDNPDSFLEPQSPGPPLAVDEQVVREHPGTVIGPYKLLDPIGEGGFGVVFMAEQQQPLRRKVALKVLKPGMDTRQVVTRFEAERQALALMDHPNIAHVFDGGETAAGRPYFVMELVCGIPITDFCDQNELPIRDRLGLFIDVCQAVQHAHQKGVIHRDIKPSNVLVTVQDERAVVKVIDFGIAKAMGQQLTDKTASTNFAQMIGTPLYMSPEQAQMSGLDVDTRSDIYSLGVLLYELLTGTTPFDRDRFRQAGYDEVRRIIRDEEPPRPSARLSTLSQTAATVSTQRQSDPRRLSQLLRGELDWVVMKCLEKDRNRRYETAGSLARDVARYLHDEPVQACPPSVTYRARKFARRNKGALAVAAALFLAVAVVASSIGWIASDRAAQRAALSQKVPGALSEATQLQAQGKYAEALEAVKRAEALLVDGFSDEVNQDVRELRRDLEMTLRLESVWFPRSGEADRQDPGSAGIDAAYASAFRIYGIDVASLEPAEAAGRVRERAIALKLTVALDHWAKVRAGMVKVPGQEHDSIRKRLLAVARAADPDAWRNQLRDALEQSDSARLRHLATSSEVADQPLQTLSLLAGALDGAGAGQEAAAVLRLAQQRYPDDFEINFQLAWSLDHGQPVPQPLDEIVRFYTAARALRPNNYAVHYFLGSALQRRGMTGEAIAVYRQAISLASKTPGVGPDHPDVVWVRHNLAMSYFDIRQPAKALALFEQVLEQRKAALGPDHPQTVAAMSELAKKYQGSGQPGKAVPLFEQALEKRKARLGPDQPETLRAMLDLAFAYRDWGRMDRAVPLFEQILEKKARLGPNDQTMVHTLNQLALAYEAAGTPGRAEPLFRELLEHHRKKNASDAQLMSASLAILGHNLLKQRKWVAAEPIFRECLAIRAKKMPDAWLASSTQSMLGEALLGQKRYAEAEPLLLQGYEGMKQREAIIPKEGRHRLTEALERLVRLYEATGQKHKADAQARELEQAVADEKKPPPAK
jgi:non-specific serine/threonine protein kinase/serine/threonine-protein kinase